MIPYIEGPWTTSRNFHLKIDVTHGRYILFCVFVVTGLTCIMNGDSYNILLLALSIIKLIRALSVNLRAVFPKTAAVNEYNLRIIISSSKRHFRESLSQYLQALSLIFNNRYSFPIYFSVSVHFSVYTFSVQLFPNPHLPPR